MAYEDYFFQPDFQNTALFREMSQYLMSAVQRMAAEKRPTIPGKEISYEALLKNRQIPKEGKPWKPAFDEFLQLFQKAVVWQSPHAMINITPPVNIPSLLGAAYTALFNPNFGTDESAGLLMVAEMYVIRNLATLAGWDTLKAGGIFTFGGKGTNLYACKTGIRKIWPNCDDDGINANECLVFTNDKAHPCHSEVAAWLGLGKRQVVSLPATQEGTVDVRVFEQQLNAALLQGRKIPCIFLNGGNTNEGYIDPIREIVAVRDRLVQKHHLHYCPHIHVDAVIGWIWLFFKNYDYESNPLKMTDSEKKRIYDNCEKISDLFWADSFGADFHKTGFCPYTSSIFMVKNHKWLAQDKDFSDLVYGEYAPFSYTLELSRSSTGPVSAYLALELFGVDGFQKLLYRVFHAGECIRDAITKHSEFILLNPGTYGFSTLFLAIPPCLLSQKAGNILSDASHYAILADYNYQFYLYLDQKYEKGELDTKITFSKSYRPFGAAQKLGALKSFPMSPIADDPQWYSCIEEILAQKKEFDQNSVRYTDGRRHAEDLVWRT